MRSHAEVAMAFEQFGLDPTTVFFDGRPRDEYEIVSAINEIERAQAKTTDDFKRGTLGVLRLTLLYILGDVEIDAVREAIHKTPPDA